VPEDTDHHTKLQKSRCIQNFQIAEHHFLDAIAVVYYSTTSRATYHTESAFYGRQIPAWGVCRFHRSKTSGKKINTIPTRVNWIRFLVDTADVR
jgi:hypothetical protein